MAAAEEVAEEARVAFWEALRVVEWWRHSVACGNTLRTRWGSP